MSDVIGAPTRFADALRRPDARGREVETALAMHLEPFFLHPHNRITPTDMIRALMGNVVAIIFAKAQSFDDAKEAADCVAAEFLRRVKEH